MWTRFCTRNIRCSVEGCAIWNTPHVIKHRLKSPLKTQDILQTLTLCAHPQSHGSLIGQPDAATQRSPRGSKQPKKRLFTTAGASHPQNTSSPVLAHLKQRRYLYAWDGAGVRAAGWRCVRVAERGEWELHVYSSVGRGLSLPNSCEWSMAANPREPDYSELWVWHVQRKRDASTIRWRR